MGTEHGIEELMRSKTQNNGNSDTDTVLSVSDAELYARFFRVLSDPTRRSFFSMCSRNFAAIRS